MSDLWDRLGEIPYGQTTAGLVGVLLLCVLSFWITRRVLLKLVASVAERTTTDWDDILVGRGVFRQLAWIAPGLVVYYFAFLFEGESEMLVQRLVLVYTVIILIATFSRFLNAVNDIYNRTSEKARELPIKGYLQVVQIVVVLIGIIVIFSTLLDQSPWGILSGLGAATALLILVFRDTILSFVASIQLATNDMVRIGDWISMPQYGADGDVIDVALHTVKVQNFDKTISTIPTHKLMDDSFRNWRGMAESGGRRIARAVNVDMTSVRFLEDEDIEQLSKVALLRDYLPAKLEEVKAWNEAHEVDPSSPVNGRRLTNLGTFRAYMIAYLRSHSMLNRDMTLLVRHLPPSSEGLPMQIYAFSKDQVWANYESIQADIFDHLLAVLPVFGLRVFQRPTGHDVQALKAAVGEAPR
jgi:miniconductance mechanosensitive channel